MHVNGYVQKEGSQSRRRVLPKGGKKGGWEKGASRLHKSLNVPKRKETSKLAERTKKSKGRGQSGDEEKILRSRM